MERGGKHGDTGGRSQSYGAETDRALSLWVVLNKAYNALSRRVGADIQSRGFANPTEWAVLEFLYHKGRQPLGRIGDHILITSGSVTYVIDKLERQGLLRRVRCPEDRRVIYGELTKEGEALMAREFPGHAETIRRLMSGLSPRDQETLRRFLKELGLSAEGRSDREAASHPTS